MLFGNKFANLVSQFNIIGDISDEYNDPHQHQSTKKI